MKNVGTKKNARACVIGNMNLRHMTLMSLYTSFFEEKGIPYDVVYIDEYGIEEPCNADRVYRFEGHSSDSPSIKARLSRVKGRLGFTRFAAEILKKENYDFIVVWREETAIQLSLLLSKYRRRYSVNIRDIDVCDGRRARLNRFLLSISIKNAAFSTVSSDGFIPYLPKADYLFLHSANDKLLEGIRPVTREESRLPIVITNIGTFRNDDYCFSLTDAFANDERFELRFIGQGSERIREYALKKDYRNVVCHGAFQPDETMQFLLDADILNCAYGADSIAEEAKLPIRFYYAVYLELPVLATEGTWIRKKADDLGFCIEVPADFSDGRFDREAIWRKFKSINRNEIHDRLNVFRTEIENSHDSLRQKLEAFLIRGTEE